MDFLFSSSFSLLSLSLIVSCGSSLSHFLAMMIVVIYLRSLMWNQFCIGREREKREQNQFSLQFVQAGIDLGVSWLNFHILCCRYRLGLMGFGHYCATKLTLLTYFKDNNNYYYDIKLQDLLYSLSKRRNILMIFFKFYFVSTDLKVAVIFIHGLNNIYNMKWP